MTAPNSRCLALINRITRPEADLRSRGSMPRGCGVIADLSLHSGRARRQARAIGCLDFLGRPHDPVGELGIGTETFRKTVPGFSRHSAQARAEACSDCFSQLAMASRTRSRVLIAPVQDPANRPESCLIDPQPGSGAGSGNHLVAATTSALCAVGPDTAYSTATSETARLPDAIAIATRSAAAR